MERLLDQLFWFLILAGWVAGVSCGYWMGRDLSGELSSIMGIPLPSQMGGWWEPLLFFTLTPLSFYLFSQLFFGASAPFLLFLRGTYDGGILIRALEASLSELSFPQLSPTSLLSVLFILLVLSINLPLCMWASHLGTSRATYVRYRLKGKPVRPGEGSSTLSPLPLLLGFSLLAGLFASLLLGHFQ